MVGLGDFAPALGLDGDEPRELQHRAVYRINTDGSVVEVTHDVEKPNGVALSPSEKTLYVGDHNNGTDKIDPTAPPPKIGAMFTTEV